MSAAREDRPRPSITVGPGDTERARAPADMNSTPEFFARAAGEAVWLRFDDAAFSLRQILQQAQAWAERLAGFGIGRGDCIGLLISNRPEFVIAWLAVNLRGAVAAFLPTTADRAGLSRYIAVAGPRAMIAEAALIEDGTSAGVALADDIVWRPIGTGTAAAPEPGAPSPADPSCIVFTSGSSGPPKGVVFSHRFVLELGHLVAIGKGMQPGERLYFCNPLFHGDGLIAMIATIALGGELHLARRFSVTQFWRDVAAYRSTIFYYVGASLSFLARNPHPATPPPHRLRFGTGGGATPAMAERFEQRFGIAVLDAYSQTECLACCSSTLAARRKGSAGRPYPGVEVRIVDALDQPVPIGETGRVVVRPPRPYMTFSGYVGDPAATVAKTRNFFLHMGDLGRLDEDGFLYFGGRAGPSLRRRGENLQPEDIEERVEHLPWVAKAAAVGVASEHGDEDILLILTTQDTAPPPDRIVAECRQVLPRIMQPRWIEIVPSLPMTPTHRISRADLPKAPGAGAISAEEVA